MTIKNDRVSEYLGTHDAIKGLQKVVENGQTRLALEVVFDILTQLFERIDHLEEDASKQKDLTIDVVPAPSPAQVKTITKAKESINEILEEEKK
jgi:hypothetical protein